MWRLSCPAQNGINIDLDKCVGKNVGLFQGASDWDAADMFVRMIIAARAAFAAQYPILVQFQGVGFHHEVLQGTGPTNYRGP